MKSPLHFTFGKKFCCSKTGGKLVVEACVWLRQSVEELLLHRWQFRWREHTNSTGTSDFLTSGVPPSARAQSRPYPVFCLPLSYPFSFFSPLSSLCLFLYSTLLSISFMSLIYCNME